MRQLFFAAPLLISFANAAQAADWTGFYVGGNGGYGLAKATADFSGFGVPLLSGSEKLDGAVYGGQAGYNYQIGRVVLGVETDLMGTSQKATGSQVCPAATCGIAVTESSDDSIPWLGTLRLRGGFAIDRFLIYATGGAGYGLFKSTQTLTTLLGSVTTSASDQRLAWVAGAGIEAAITRNWSVKLEYLYLDTGTFNTTYSVLGVGAIVEQSRMTESMTRIGVNYRF